MIRPLRRSRSTVRTRQDEPLALAAAGDWMLRAPVVFAAPDAPDAAAAAGPAAARLTSASTASPCANVRKLLIPVLLVIPVPLLAPHAGARVACLRPLTSARVACQRSVFWAGRILRVHRI